MTGALRADHGEIVQKYGERFTDIVGADLIAKLPELEVSDKRIIASFEDGESPITLPSHIGEYSAVRGTLDNTIIHKNLSIVHFIAIKVDLIDSLEEKYGTVLEVITRSGTTFKRAVNLELEEAVHVEYYNSGFKKRSYYTQLSSDFTIRENIQKIKKMLEGEKLNCVTSTGREIKGSIQKSAEPKIVVEEQEARLSVIQKYCTMNLLEIGNVRAPSFIKTSL